MDKSTDFNNENLIVVKVSTNEAELGDLPMGTLDIKRNISSFEEIELNYLANDCEHSETDLCLKDSSIETKIRFYEIDVNVTDKFGRSDSDTCYIVIVPKCKGNKSSKSDPTEEGICTSFLEEHHKYHHDKHADLDHSHHSKKYPEKLKYDKNHPKGHYLNLEYLSQLVKSSTTRRDIVSLHSVWRFSVAPEPYDVEADRKRAAADYVEKMSVKQDNGGDGSDGGDGVPMQKVKAKRRRSRSPSA